MKTAVVLYNLGGPDSLKAVRPFLFNLFNDAAIIGLPQPLRALVALIISQRRARTAQAIYQHLGGASPILAHTRDQAEALERSLREKGDYKVFIAMRHWHPLTREAVAQVKAYAPDKILMLPLYPQFSTTTTQSAFSAWYREAYRQKLQAPHQPICCYPFEEHMTEGFVARIEEGYDEAARHGVPRLLFSAHGLPEKIVRKGDPYQWQVERTVSAITRKLGNVDYVICYQSRVGPLAWIGPSTEAELRRAGQEKRPVLVIPVSFVSEHSETLVELDIEYRHLAQQSGIPYYGRVAALGSHPAFIEALAWLCEVMKFYPNCSNSHGRICPKEFQQCGFRQWERKA
jgi:ferrochelatase